MRRLPRGGGGRRARARGGLAVAAGLCFAAALSLAVAVLAPAALAGLRRSLATDEAGIGDDGARFAVLSRASRPAGALLARTVCGSWGHARRQSRDAIEPSV